MQKHINEENLRDFVLRMEFKPKISYIDHDCAYYYDEFFMGNYFYKMTVLQYEKSHRNLIQAKKYAITFFVLSGIGVFYFQFLA